jgi:hypothetical protein
VATVGQNDDRAYLSILTPRIARTGSAAPAERGVLSEIGEKALNEETMGSPPDDDLPIALGRDGIDRPAADRKAPIDATAARVTDKHGVDMPAAVLPVVAHGNKPCARIEREIGQRHRSRERTTGS